MITVQDADRLLRAHVRVGAPVTVSLGEACGRVLREDVAADRDAPPFDRVAMDGVALRAETVRTGTPAFRVASVQRAGEPPHILSGSGSCVEVATGAALPAGCDAVVPYEHLRIDGETVVLLDGHEVRSGQNVHARGLDRRAGEAVLRAGTWLYPTHVAALASVGKAVVSVSARPRVAVVTTGDELVDVGAAALPHQIRRSNGPAIRAALLRRGHPDVTSAHVPDDEAPMRRTLSALLGEADVVVLTGGVSAGRFDLVPGVLAALGVAEVFHRVRQRPGKPLWFGTTADGRAVFGLPGNPVSALVGLYRYVLPFLEHAAGGAPPAPSARILTALPARTNDFTHFVPVQTVGLEARPVRSSGSGDFLSLLATDGFVEVASEMAEPGAVPFFSWS